MYKEHKPLINVNQNFTKLGTIDTHIMRNNFVKYE